MIERKAVGRSYQDDDMYSLFLPFIFAVARNELGIFYTRGMRVVGNRRREALRKQVSQNTILRNIISSGFDPRECDQYTSFRIERRKRRRR